MVTQSDLAPRDGVNTDNSQILEDSLFFRGPVSIQISKLKTFDDDVCKAELVKHGFDMFDKPIDDTPHSRLLREYVNNPGLDLEATEYRRLLEFMLSLHDYSYVNHRGERIESSLERTRAVLRLYEVIKVNRYIEPITVRALHDGTFRIMDGFHRSAIALSLGYKKVPCIIDAVETEIEVMLGELLSDYPEGRKELYIPISHPIFRDWKITRNRGRWNLIARECQWKKKRVLDIGSYTGFFSRQIARKGAIVLGVELDERRLNIARQLNTLLGVKAEFICEDFRDVLRRATFDCVLCFSVLHWILMNEGIDQVTRSLMLISEAAPIMFFDIGQNDQKGSKMETAEWNRGLVINKETIPALVFSNSRFTHVKYLGKSNLGRDVFKFWRDAAVARASVRNQASGFDLT